jgi:CheY-like chemotaxis protein
MDPLQQPSSNPQPAATPAADVPQPAVADATTMAAAPAQPQATAVDAPAPTASVTPATDSAAPVAPAAPADAPPTAPATPDAAPAAGQAAPAGDPQLLLAEDEEDARLIYLDIISGAGLKVEGAENGKATLDKLASKAYDLLLLDIIMPDMDGISVLAEIKKYPAKYGTPKVVMLTNIGGDLAIEKALQIGANGYMLKSETEPDELVRTIKRYLAGEDHVKAKNGLIPS